MIEEVEGFADVRSLFVEAALAYYEGNEGIDAADARMGIFEQEWRVILVMCFCKIIEESAHGGIPKMLRGPL